MIGRLEGQLFEKTPTRVLVDVGGVGYEAWIPLSTFTRLPDPGKRVALRVYTHLRENALTLYGFATELERDVFELLLHASRVGPKLALTVLSGLEAPAVLTAIRTGNALALQGVSGVGAKLAQRMVLELRERALELIVPGGEPGAPAAAAGAAPEARAQLLSALVNLQVPRSQAERIVEEVIAEHGDEAPIEALVRAALPRLSR
ncbi:MAG TPA: Holliday junction branch migration protein RuvA [Myxococcota bacterium]|nr:Holliday junction branch migration protein RuvA [Myxococcota bacterium]